MPRRDRFGVVRSLQTSTGTLSYYSLPELERQGYRVSHLPFSLRILLENILRSEDGFTVTEEHVHNLLSWQPRPPEREIPFMPTRILMQDFTGVPAIVDLASLRAEAARKGVSPERINPLIPVDLVIDHSVQVDFFGTIWAYERNVELEYQRNRERYSLLKWAQQAFRNLTVLPPGMGICHQVNLEYLAQVVAVRDGIACPDTLVGTDSHTPMVNGIGVLGWGVGGIEAEAAMLGQPLFLLLPEVIGLRLIGELSPGVTATDLVLTITELLRRYGVVGKFVEVFGPGLNSLTVPDRATIANMSPEFGCTVTYFPVDNQTLEYLRATARPPELIERVEWYCKENLLWREAEESIQYTDVLTLDLSTVEPTLAGPRRPHDRVPLRSAKATVISSLEQTYNRAYVPIEERWETIAQAAAIGSPGSTVAVATRPSLRTVPIRTDGLQFLLSDGAVVIAAITSCTNTSNPTVMLAAGLLAQKAVKRGLRVKPWVKTSLAPGSRVVTQYLRRSGLLDALEALGFHVVGYGCTTCIGNSGNLPEPIARAITDNELVVAAVLSGNRNFEARVHPQVRMNFLASPPLVVAYALAGRVDIDLLSEPLGTDPNGEPVYLRDIWPSPGEVRSLMEQVLRPEDFRSTYSSVYAGDRFWQELEAPKGELYQWDPDSTYIREAPFFRDLPLHPPQPGDIRGARVLLWLGDTVTTDHISPAGSISPFSPAGRWLIEHGVDPLDFNSYGARRGNHEVMVRGTFANIRLRNALASREGGWTRYFPSGEELTVYDAAMRYLAEGVPTIVLAGKEYGSGSSRDWAAKGPALLGIRAVIAESFERIHRSNLVGMGILPLQFPPGESAMTLGLDGSELYDIIGISDGLAPQKVLRVIARKPDGSTREFSVIARLDVPVEVEYYRHGGVLQYVFRNILQSTVSASP
ncbi:MAG: aconitate hydratase AcnA [Candidatus Kapabacteria bacterium]|nr:aconitate hydratase AcnA [Candidatus Kapabacteria bacterium]MDW8012449.1 aconitate hydratase AcnA [Bacteroidota bacterium]